MFRSSRERLAWFALTIFLGLQFRYDPLRVLSPAYKAIFQADSDELVLLSLGDAGRGLFDPMLRPEGDDYTSQFGLQGIVMAAVSPGTTLYGAMRLMTALLLAAVLATAVVACWRAWGGRAAGVLLALLTLSTWLNGFGPSTYWQLWTMLLPTLVPLLVWHRLGEGRRKWLRGGALIAGLVFLKALCGYEYITTVILGATAAVAFHEFRDRVDRRLVVSLAGSVVSGVVGFALAIAVHLGQLLALYGSVSILSARAGDRTFAPLNGDSYLVWVRAQAENDHLARWIVEGDSAFGLWAYRMTGYLRDSAIALPGRPGLALDSYSVPIWVFVLVFLALTWAAFRAPAATSAIQRRLAVAAGISLVGALSWLVLAFGHMVQHPHINAIVFYVPFLPLVFAMIALRLQAVSRRAWPPRDEDAYPPAAEDDDDEDEDEDPSFEWTLPQRRVPDMVATSRGDR